MKKSERITALVDKLASANHQSSGFDPHYAGFFTAFNQQQYYEAHDVLEQLWLPCRDRHALFYQALIQCAGAFVHLQKQFAHPLHPKHGRRLRPASRLFLLSAKNLSAFAPRHLHLDVSSLTQSCLDFAERIIRSDYTLNPWDPAAPPQMHLESPVSPPHP
jgi:hypothetical protein